MNADPGASLVERLGSMTPSEALLRTRFHTIEPARTMQAPSHPWDHEIRVALPMSYDESDRLYPTLWVMDNDLEAALTVLGGTADIILVSVGAGRVPFAEATRRRTYDLTPSENLYFDGPSGDYFRDGLSVMIPGVETCPAGGARAFLDFLVDDVRPALAAEYRMDAGDHGLFGFSFGGTFVANALFARPGEFAKYICGSPALYVGDGVIFQMEDEYARTHDDLHATVFFGSGEGEMTEFLLGPAGCVSSMVKMVEILTCRGYPSLRLTVKIFPGESHTTMLGPLISWGVRSVWGDEIAGKAVYEQARREASPSTADAVS